QLKIRPLSHRKMDTGVTRALNPATLSPERRLRRFLGDRLSSSPSANSGSNGGVFLRGVSCRCGVFLDEWRLPCLPLHRRNSVSAPRYLSLSLPLPPSPLQPPLPRSLLSPPPSSTVAAPLLP
ncbi:unnamed protein product, partial [Musa banksii]